MAQQAEKRGLFGLGGRKDAEPGARGSLAPARMATAADDALTGDEIMRLNLKALAGAAAQPPIRYADHASAALEPIGMMSRPPVVADIARPSFGYWCRALQCFVRPHRKLWEFASVLQAFYEGGVLVEGARVLGFGVGDEPIASYLASLGLQVVATDLHGVTGREAVMRPNMIDEETFDRLVEVSDVDIRRTDDATLRGFDGIWSCSVINQLANVDAAADAVIEAMDTLRPGGVAVHTAEFAFADDTVRQQPGALRFPRRFFQGLADALDGRGHTVAPVSFALGEHPMDAYIDLDPYEVNGAEAYTDLWREGLGAPHLKVLNGGVLTTSFAMVVSRRP